MGKIEERSFGIAKNNIIDITKDDDTVGAWGTGIFEDDTALDVRHEYVQLLLDGLPDHEATQMVLERFEDDATDPDYQVIFWTALALTQWETGRLENLVKEKTLSLIEEGDSPLWQEEEGSAEERKAVLDDLKQKLDSPQPPRMDKAALLVYQNGEADTVDKPELDNTTEEQAEQERRLDEPVEKKWWQFWR